VAHFLLQQAGENLHSFELKFTQQQLSELFGVTRPALSRVFSEMQREKLFIIEKKTVTILNRTKVKRNSSKWIILLFYTSF
jgi:CRP/FNR family transcriptional regulator, dissimilatory nitrate respiration regulator